MLWLRYDTTSYFTCDQKLTISQLNLPRGTTNRPNKVSPRLRRNDMLRPSRPFPMAAWLRWSVGSTSSIKFPISILFYTVFQKGRHQIHGCNCIIINRYWNFFTVRFFSKLATKPSIKYPTQPHLVHQCQNERQLQTNVTNDRSQSTVVTYLKCRGIVNNQMKKGLLLSLPVKKIKVGEYVAYLWAER